MKKQPEIATVVFLLEKVGDDFGFYLAEKKQDVHKDDGEALPNTQVYNGYGGKLDIIDEGSIHRCAIRELFFESGVIAKQSNLINAGEHIKFFWPKNNSVECDMEVSFFLLKKYIGKPRESREMGPPKLFTTKNAPYGNMLPGDKIIVPLIMKGNDITGSEIYFKEENGKMVLDIDQSKFSPSRPLTVDIFN